MIVYCRNCKNRYTDNCPMYFEEYVEWDDDGYHESDYIVHDNKEKPIRAEDVMRQYLNEFCERHWCCTNCVLRTDDFTCGRGYSFTGITPVSDEEVRRAYAEVMKK